LCGLARCRDSTSSSAWPPAIRSEPERQRPRRRAGMRERARQEGPSDSFCSCHQPPKLEDDREPWRQRIARLANAQRVSKRAKKESPRTQAGGSLTHTQASAYLLTCTLVPLPGVAPRAPVPLETTLTQSASWSLKYEVSLALRSPSRLLCCVPEAAVVNPGSSKITHEPASISVRVRFRDGRSVATFISVPARTLPELKVYSLPLRVRT